jgi:DNA repair protein RecN (Recombination protein N)
MLTQLNISNYTITERIDLNFDRGMTVITGETGAGKSITLNGLGLALGDRADSKAVGPHADRAEIYAGFDISVNSAAQAWFDERDMPRSEELMLRRVIYADGKSRAYINGKPATLNDIKSLGTTLIDIHGQHDHQSLLKRDNQRLLLDAYANTEALARQVTDQVHQCRQLERTIDTLKNQDEAQTARLQLLRYQVEELEQVNPAPDELKQLEHEQRALATASDNLTASHQALRLCRDDQHGASTILQQAAKALEQLAEHDGGLTEVWQLLDSARIQVEEAEQSLQAHIDAVEVNPARLEQVEKRLSSIYQIARKHRVQADELPALWRSLGDELANLDGGEEKITQLESQLETLAIKRDQLAAKLSQRRRKAATHLCDEVNQLLGQLSMPHCHFQIAQTPLAEIGPHGSEHIEFVSCNNPGQAAQPISKIASGGELSRIGLAIQVATSHTSGTPTLIFDEVDTGIGGGVAEIVGNLLSQLGQGCQVFCITHLAQVACKGDHHFVVAKQASEHCILSEINQLKNEDKITEIARMLGGIAITEQTLAHAAEMLSIQH